MSTLRFGATNCQEKVAVYGRHQQVIAKELVKDIGAERVPSNGVGDGSEDPVELPTHGATILNLPCSELYVYHTQAAFGIRTRHVVDHVASDVRQQDG